LELRLRRVEVRALERARTLTTPVLPDAYPESRQEDFQTEVVDSEALQDSRARAQAAFAKLVEEAEAPTDESCNGIGVEPVVYNFAIGSIFNDESRRSSSLFAATRSRVGPTKNLTNGDFTFNDVVGSAPGSYRLVTVAKGFVRKWTNVNGPPTNFWAVSLHKDASARAGVFGGLVASSRETFVEMSSRETGYDYLVVPPEDVLLGDDDLTLRTVHPCGKVIVYAYGYKSNPPSIVDVNFLKQTFPASACQSGTAQYKRVCALNGVNCSTTPCYQMFVTSYLDVVMAGLLVKGLYANIQLPGVDYKVWGGTGDSIFSEESIRRTNEFVNTTVWPNSEIAAGKVLYINDRRCPRNKNPLWTPASYLVPPHRAGTSSSYSHIDVLFEQIDSILSANPFTKEMFKHRVNQQVALCDELDVIARADTDALVDDPFSLWNLAYTNGA